MTTDFTSVFSDREPVKAVGYDLTRAAADLAYWESGVGPDDLDLDGRVVSNPSGGLLSQGSRLAATVSHNVPNSYGSDAQPQRIYDWKKVIPIGRAGVPEEAAAVNLFCTPESDDVTGHLIVCSGRPVF